MSFFSAVSVLERDPDLGDDLSPQEFELARQQAVARVVHFPKGPWTVRRRDFKGSGNLGLLITEGILVRKVTVGDRTCAELLGPGDVVQPWLRLSTDSSIGTEIHWQVAQPLAMAVLDRGFMTRAARWPEIAAAISRRLMLRVHWLSFHLAVCHMRRVDDRLLLVLWHFSDRWGRVTPGGVQIDLPLTHSLLAAVVGARRPSVTAAVRALTEAGKLKARPRSRWLLVGQAPVELRQMHQSAAHYNRPAPLELIAEQSDEESP
jgi:CRP/FNR family cyclic AMP-dependent transcriptional regulator